MLFLILSTPRSSSAWQSAFYTTEKSHCIHDPSVSFNPKDKYALTEFIGRISKDKNKGMRFGIADTAVCLMPDMIETAIQELHLNTNDRLRVLVLDRNVDGILKSFKKMPLGMSTSLALRMARESLLAVDRASALCQSMGVPVARASYGRIFEEDVAVRVWTHLMPGHSFDHERFRILSKLNVQSKFDSELNPHFLAWVKELYYDDFKAGMIKSYENN